MSAWGCNYQNFKFAEILPEILGRLAEDFDTTKYEEARKGVRQLLVLDRILHFVGGTKKDFQDLLVSKYNASKSPSAKILYLVCITNNTYRSCHQAKEIEVFKNALIDENFKNTEEVADLTINY